MIMDWDPPCLVWIRCSIGEFSEADLLSDEVHALFDLIRELS